MIEFEDALKLLVDRWQASPRGPASGIFSPDEVCRTIADFERSNGIRLPGAYLTFLIETAEIDTTLIEDCFTFWKAHELELSRSADPLCASIVFADWLVESHFYVIRFERDTITVASTIDPDDVYECFEQFIIEFATWGHASGGVGSNRPERTIDRYRTFPQSDALS